MSPGAALWSGVRAVALRSPRANPVGSGPGLFVLLTVVYYAVALVLAMLEVDVFWIGNTLFFIGAVGATVGTIVSIVAYRGVFRG